jgi:hypothetical protein
MERELLMNTNTLHFTKSKMMDEVNCVKSILPYIESFTAFKTYNEVFNMKKSKKVRFSYKLSRIFYKGIENYPEHFIICMN